MMEAINMIKPTSKASLKQTCLYLSNLDVAKAERMYDFLIKGIESIPDVEPETKPLIKNIGEQAGDVLGWLRENQDMLSQGVSLVKGIFGKKTAPAVPLPPINE